MSWIFIDWNQKPEDLDRPMYLPQNLAFLRQRTVKPGVDLVSTSAGGSATLVQARRGAPQSVTMTQEDLGELVGCTQGFAGRIEIGKAVGTPQLLGRIAKLFGVTMDELLFVDLEARFAADSLADEKALAQ